MMKVQPGAFCFFVFLVCMFVYVCVCLCIVLYVVLYVVFNTLKLPFAYADL
jgi:hypothetical protein